MQVNLTLNPQSPQAEAISHLFIITLIIAAFILSIVTGLVIYIALRYRSNSSSTEPKQEFGRPRLEIVWTIVPIAIVATLFVLMFRTMRAADPSPRNEPDLVVVGHQWWWEVRYPQASAITANEIHIPSGKPLLVELRSADVIHDFWVPQLARKMDMIPGQVNHIWIEADQPGTYQGACAEYCGAEHAWMRIRVVAEPPQKFAAWLQGQTQAPPSPAGGDAARGAQLFQQLTCSNCHAIGGTQSSARIGPDLTHLAARQTLAAGRLDNNSDNLAKWLANPQAIKPGTYMPNLELTDDQVRQLTSYLETLR